MFRAYRVKNRRPPVQKRSVRDRWHLPTGTQHLSVPLPALAVILDPKLNLGPQEIRTILWLLADWFWAEGTRRKVNGATLARKSSADRSNLYRALKSLHQKGLIELSTPGSGRGRKLEVSIIPLIELSHKTASQGLSQRQHKASTNSVSCHGDNARGHGDNSSVVTPEPGVQPVRGLISDASQTAPPLSDASPNGNGHDRQRAEALRRAALLDTLKQLETDEQKGQP